MTTIDDATLRELFDVASRLRDEDRAELSVTRDPNNVAQLAHDAWGGVFCKIAKDARGEPLMAFGAKMQMSDVASVWGFGTARSHEAGLAVTRFVLRCMVPALSSLGVQRVFCAVHSENYNSRRWLAFLGFVPEATFVGIGTHREDMLLYAKYASVRPVLH
jgi:hypothetical protein